MFGEVWRWAGSYRETEVNIEIDSHLVPARMPELLDTVRFFNKTKNLPSDEIAVRLHHGLTQIHGFPNGNGRHAREMADFTDSAFGWRSLHLGQ